MGKRKRRRNQSPDRQQGTGDVTGRSQPSGYELLHAELERYRTYLLDTEWRQPPVLDTKRVFVTSALVSAAIGIGLMLSLVGSSLGMQQALLLVLLVIVGLTSTLLFVVRRLEFSPLRHWLWWRETRHRIDDCLTALRGSHLTVMLQVVDGDKPGLGLGIWVFSPHGGLLDKTAFVLPDNSTGRRRIGAVLADMAAASRGAVGGSCLLSYREHRQVLWAHSCEAQVDPTFVELLSPRAVQKLSELMRMAIGTGIQPLSSQLYPLLQQMETLLQQRMSFRGQASTDQLRGQGPAGPQAYRSAAPRVPTPTEPNPLLAALRERKRMRELLEKARWDEPTFARFRGTLPWVVVSMGAVFFPLTLAILLIATGGIGQFLGFSLELDTSFRLALPFMGFWLTLALAVVSLQRARLRWWRRRITRQLSSGPLPRKLDIVLYLEIPSWPMEYKSRRSRSGSNTLLGIGVWEGQPPYRKLFAMLANESDYYSLAPQWGFRWAGEPVDGEPWPAELALKLLMRGHPPPERRLWLCAARNGKVEWLQDLGDPRKAEVPADWPEEYRGMRELIELVR